LVVVLRISDGTQTFYITDPEFSWDVEPAKMRLDLEWDVLLDQVGDLPRMIPGRRVSVEAVLFNGSFWEVAPHMVNGEYIIEDISVSRSTRHLRCALSLRRSV